MFLRLVRAVARVTGLFLLVAEWYCMVRRHLRLLIHSPVEGHFDCFYVWVTMNNAAESIHREIFVCIHIFVFLLDRHLGVEVQGCVACSTSGKLANCFPGAGGLYHFAFLSAAWEGSGSSTSLSALTIVSLFNLAILVSTWLCLMKFWFAFP